VYDFHHIDPSIKEEGIGTLINKGWKRLEAELKKCIVLCSNCHRIEHNCNEKD
jgi:predicted HNH restriction endonuclease